MSKITMERQEGEGKHASSTKNWIVFLGIDQHQFQHLCWILETAALAPAAQLKTALKKQIAKM